MEEDTLIVNKAVAAAIARSGDDWREVPTTSDGSPTPGHVTVVHRNGMRFNIHIPWKKKMPLITLNVGHLDVSNDARIRATNYNATTRLNPDYILRTLHDLVIGEAGDHYREILAEIARAERDRKQVQKDAELLARVLNTKLRNSDPVWQADKERKPELTINHGDLHLVLQAQRPGMYHITGYSNTIPTDLMLDIAQVINRWIKEKNREKQVSCLA